MRQPFETRELGGHGAVDLGDGGDERECGKRILRVVPADKVQVGDRHQERAATCKPGAPRMGAAIDDAPRLFGFGNAGAKCLHEPAGELHRERARIVAV